MQEYAVTITPEISQKYTSTSPFVCKHSLTFHKAGQGMRNWKWGMMPLRSPHSFNRLCLFRFLSRFQGFGNTARVMAPLPRQRLWAGPTRQSLAQGSEQVPPAATSPTPATA